MTRSLIAIVALAGLAVASCGADDTNRNPQTVEIVVPAGTQDRLDRGEPVDVMPAKLTFRVGDTLLIRNDDRVDQYVGPYLVRAGQQFELTYGAPGHYQGLCTLSGSAGYEIVITG
jgi:hypothetical protein